MHMKKLNEEMKGSHVLVSGICDITGSEYSVELLPWQYGSWINGDKVTDFAPNMSADQREFLITGTTPGEWNEMFADLEE